MDVRYAGPFPPGDVFLNFRYLSQQAPENLGTVVIVGSRYTQMITMILAAVRRVYRVGLDVRFVNTMAEARALLDAQRDADQQADHTE